MPESRRPERFPPETAPSDAIGINARCVLKTRDRHRVVLVAGVPIAHYAVGDAMADEYRWCIRSRTGGRIKRGRTVARTFDRSERSVRRYRHRFDGGGLVALGRRMGTQRTGRAVLQAP